MYKKLLFLVSIGLVLSLSANVFGDQETYWHNGADDNMWTNADNWNISILPNSTQTGWAMHDRNEPDVNCVIEDGMDANCYQFRLGHSEGNELIPCTLEMEGGSLYCADFFHIGSHYGGYGVWKMSGGSATIGGGFTVGHVSGGLDEFGVPTGGLAILEMTGGTIKCEDSPFIVGHTGKGVVNMSGGLIDVTNEYLCTLALNNWYGDSHWIEGEGTINMSGGTINISKHLAVGQYAKGTINMTGGEINVVGQGASLYVSMKGPKTIAEPIDADGGCRIQLDGGLITARNLSMKHDRNHGTIDVAGGTMVIYGDARSQIADYVEDEKVTSHSGRAEVTVSYDSIEDETTLTAGSPDFGKAWDPNPENLTTGGIVDPVLTWASGDWVDEHIVYISEDYSKVSGADNSVKYGPYAYDHNNFDVAAEMGGNLSMGTTYFWRVDEVNDTTTWEGDIWSYTPIGFTEIEDFESYHTNPNLRAAWQAAGSYDAEEISSAPDPFHADGNAMAFIYYNVISPYDSYTTRTFDTAMDLSKSDTQSLSIWILGNEDSEPEQLYMKLIDSGDDVSAAVIYGGATPDTDVTSLDEWTEWKLDLADFAATNFDLNAVKKMRIGIGGTGSSTGEGLMVFDDIRVYAGRCNSDDVPGDFTGDCAVNTDDLEVLSRDWLDTDITVYKSVPVGTPIASYEFNGNLNDSNGTNHGTGYNDPTTDNDMLNLDGIDDYVDYGNSDEFNNLIGDLTIAVWVKVDSGNLTGYNEILAKAGTTTAFSLRTFHNKIVQFNVEGSEDRICKIKWPVGRDEYDPEAPYLDNEWHHMAGVWDPNYPRESGGFGRASLYIDGVEVNSSEPSRTGTVQQTPDPVRMGSTGEDDMHEPFRGSIDTAKIYDRALSKAEIMHLAGMDSVFYPLTSSANVVDDGIVNFKDFAVMAADNWLGGPQTWP